MFDSTSARILIEPFDRQTLGDHAADGQTDENAIADVEVIEQRFGVFDQCTHCIGRRGHVGVPVAALVIAYDAQAFGKVRQDRIPQVQIGAQ